MDEPERDVEAALLAAGHRPRQRIRLLGQGESLEQLVDTSRQVGPAEALDAALQLETRDLRMMTRLVRAQDKMINAGTDDAVVEALYRAPMASA